MTEILTPVGRLVQGSLSKGSTKGFKNEDLVWKSGVNAGMPRTVWYAGLAIDKNDPGLPAFFATMQAVATAGYPGGQAGQSTFAWKMIDGDGVDKDGKPYAEREGHAGCYIFRFTTSYPIKCSKDNGAGLLVEIPPEEIKKGYYIRIAGSITAGDDLKPSIFLNMNMVQLVGYGTEIQSGPDANQVFGGTNAAPLPAGASATPLAPATGAFEQASAPVQQPPVQPMQQPVLQQPAQQPPVQQAPVQPMQQPVLQQPAQPMQQPAQPNTNFAQPPGIAQ